MSGCKKGFLRYCVIMLSKTIRMVPFRGSIADPCQDEAGTSSFTSTGACMWVIPQIRVPFWDPDPEGAHNIENNPCVSFGCLRALGVSQPCLFHSQAFQPCFFVKNMGVS